ncbi:hypothetical protein Tsubulata_009981, partial [Turnera subulata]
LVPAGDQPQLAPGNANFAAGQQWQIFFARFINYPSIPSTSSYLVPRPHNRRYRPTPGTWISTQSPTATLQLQQPLHLDQYSAATTTTDAILSVHFLDKILTTVIELIRGSDMMQEEHYVSKLQFHWPQVSCIPGYPSRGTRAVFASYLDSTGEIQKFAMRFSTASEAEETCMEDSSTMAPMNTYSPEIPLRLNYDVEQDLYTKPATCLKDSSHMAPFNTYSTQPPLKMNYAVDQESHTKKEAASQIFDNISPTLPPSFTSLLNDCCPDVSQGRQLFQLLLESSRIYASEG